MILFINLYSPYDRLKGLWQPSLLFLFWLWTRLWKWYTSAKSAGRRGQCQECLLHRLCYHTGTLASSFKYSFQKFETNQKQSWEKLLQRSYWVCRFPKISKKRNLQGWKWSKLSVKLLWLFKLYGSSLSTNQRLMLRKRNLSEMIYKETF